MINDEWEVGSCLSSLSCHLDFEKTIADVRGRTQGRLNRELVNQRIRIRLKG